MSRIIALLAASLLVPGVVVLSGCDQVMPVRVRAVPLPPAERPPMNLPVSLRQRNWLSANQEGSCVHASMTSLFRWHNQLRLAEWWRTNYSGGENEIDLQRKLRERGVPYTSVNQGQAWFLDEASRTRHGCILWWKPGHCCTFCGWVRGEDGVIYGAILDNNYPNRIELTERSKLIRLWNGYGGFALTLQAPPTTPIPAQSYEVIR